MSINDQIRNEKLQNDINKEAAKTSALSSGKLHKYEYLTGEQWKEQIKPIKEQRMPETIERYTYGTEDSPFISKQKKKKNI